MSGTSNKLPYIKSTDDTKYGNLKEEVLDLHTQIESNDDDITAIQGDISAIQDDITAIQTTVSGLSTDITNEVVTARGAWATLDDRLDAIDAYTVTNDMQTLGLTRHYTYDAQGYVTMESIRGGYNYDIVYIYNTDYNIIKEEIYDITPTLIGYREYTYNAEGNVIDINSVNAEILSIATNTLVTNELDERLKTIEAMDLIKTASVLNGDDAIAFVNAMQGFSARLEILETMLPGNITNIADIPYIMDKIAELQNKVDKTFVLYEFEVMSGWQTYDVPADIDETTFVQLEGLTLIYGEDYTISGGKMTFNIPLIDNFRVVCRY